MSTVRRPAAGSQHAHHTTPARHVTPREIVEGLGGRWRGDRGRCICPAHDDHHPSLDVLDRGGRTLVVCRAGCRQEAVIEALRARGLWSAGSPRAQRRRLLADVLAASAREALVVAVAGDSLCSGRALAEVDRDRVRLAVARLRTAAEEVGHAHL